MTAPFHTAQLYAALALESKAVSIEMIEIASNARVDNPDRITVS